MKFFYLNGDEYTEMTRINPSGKAVFITGTTGVIGHALARRFAAAGQRIIAPVRVHDNPDGLRKKRAEAFQSLLRDAGGSLVPLSYQDLLQKEALKDQEERLGGCEIIYHLGGWAGHKISEEEFPDVLLSNVLWTGLLAGSAQQKKIKRFVFASTRSVYDFIPRKPEVPLVVNERTRINLPIKIDRWKEKALLAFNDYLGFFLRGATDQSPQDFCREYLMKNPPPNLRQNLWYPLSKLMGESFVSSLWKQGIEGISLRLKPVFGPSPVEHDSRIIPKTVARLKENHSMTAWPEKGSYLYLEDLVSALMVLNPAMSDSVRIPPGTRVILLGQKRQLISQFSLLKKIAAALNPRFKIDFDPLAPKREDEIYDGSLAEDLLGFKPTPFKEALEKTVKYYASQTSKHFR